MQPVYQLVLLDRAGLPEMASAGCQGGMARMGAGSPDQPRDLGLWRRCDLLASALKDGVRVVSARQGNIPIPWTVTSIMTMGPA